ncbi:MAG: hypothetical protein ACI9PY_003741 [Ascidiaceihabitans sp.]|jgi:hypothetical protein
MSVMNTGICKALCLWLTVATLSACTSGTELNFLQGSGSSAASVRAPLTQAQMMRGAVTLVPSSGYCIDASSLKQNFALLARCDTLGAKNGALDAPLGIMTVSLVESSLPALTLSEVVQAADSTTIVERFDSTGIEIARATAASPKRGMAKSHWRAVTQINGTDLSIALFAPLNSPALGTEGRRMIESVISSSQSASVATSVAAEIQPKATNSEKGLAATIAGLFD